MLSEEIKSIHAALGVLAGSVTEEQWALLSMIRQNLKAAAEQAAQYERTLTVEAA